MERICQKCHKTYSSRQSLWNHKKYCKGGTNHHSFLAKSQNQQPIKKPRDHDTLATILSEKREQNQQHSKTLNPKISALADSIIDEEPSSKDKPTTSPESLTTPPAPKKKTLSISKLFSLKKTPPRVAYKQNIQNDQLFY